MAREPAEPLRLDYLIKAGAIHTMTGQTHRSVGVRGPEADRLGSITPGKFADLVGYPADPLAADPDSLKDLTPAFTMVGGRATHHPDKRLAR